MAGARSADTGGVPSTARGSYHANLRLVRVVSRCMALVLSVQASVQTQRVYADISLEAAATFAWFDTLGFPDVAGCRYCVPTFWSFPEEGEEAQII